MIHELSCMIYEIFQRLDSAPFVYDLPFNYYFLVILHVVFIVHSVSFMIYDLFKRLDGARDRDANQ